MDTNSNVNVFSTSGGGSSFGTSPNGARQFSLGALIGKKGADIEKLRKLKGSVPEGAAVSGAVHALPAGAAVGGVGWGAVLAMQETDGGEAGAPAAEDGGWDDWMGDWDGGGGGAAEMEESGL